MKVKMRRKMRGSPNGISVRVYEAGEVYDSEDGFITDRLCRVFIGADVADEVNPAEPDEQKIVSPEETKASEPERSLDDRIAGLLADAGFMTPADIASASDDDLLSISGIGPASLEEIRQAFPQN